MELKVWPEKLGKEPTYLRLVENDGDIELYAVDAQGVLCLGCKLLAITSDGCLKRYPEVSSRLGFKLDERGRVWQVE